MFAQSTGCLIIWKSSFKNQFLFGKNMLTGRQGNVFMLNLQVFKIAKPSEECIGRDSCNVIILQESEADEKQLYLFTNEGSLLVVNKNNHCLSVHRQSANKQINKQ